MVYRRQFTQNSSQCNNLLTDLLQLTPVIKRDIKATRQSPPPIKKTTYHSLPQPENWDQLPPGVGNLPEDVQGCGVNITPPCWKALYQLPEYNPPSTTANSLGLYEQGDYFAISDVQSYLAKYAPYVPLDHLPIPALIDGAAYSFPANNTDYVGGEANIDIDIALVIIIQLYFNSSTDLNLELP
jgi:tripeptidyl-peptidase-1